METLSSYFVYMFFSFPVLPIMWISGDYQEVAKASGYGIFVALFSIGISAWFIFFLSRSKRVYYKSANLYIRNLFSNKEIILNASNIGYVQRLSRTTLGIWDILYYDENNDAKHVYFIRDPMCLNFAETIRQFN